MGTHIARKHVGTFSDVITSHASAQALGGREILVFFSLFALYLAIVVIAASPQFAGDEGGYVDNAMRIAYHLPVAQQDLRLWWGLGYPLVLVPCIFLRLPWIFVKLLNAVFLLGAIAYFHALIRRYIPRTTALMITLCLGLYPPLMRDLHELSSETLTLFLICGFMFHFAAMYNTASRFRVNLFAASAYLAYLALTKVFFGYVIAATLASLLVLLLWRQPRMVRTASGVFLLALIWSTPYLLYTYSLTGRVFYWGTSGGMQLYWMTTPYPNEYGSWFSVKDVKERPELAPHREFFATLEGLSDLQRDDAFKKQALHNIARYPGKYLYHWAANIGRLLFSYPFSFGSQSLTTYFYILPDMFVIVLFALSTIPAAMRWRTIPFELWILLGFALIAFGGSTLLSAYDRQFRPLIPVLEVWIAFVYIRVLRIELYP